MGVLKFCLLIDLERNTQHFQCSDRVKMSNIRLCRRRNNQPSTCFRIAANQNERLMISAVSPTPPSHDNRNQKIMDFYNRKTVAHRRAPLTELTPPASEMFRSQELQSEPTTISNGTRLLSPYPSSSNQVVRSPWVLRQPVRGEVQQTSSLSGNSGNHGLSVQNMVEPVGSFVLLQPLVIGVQGLEVRSPQVPPFSREEHHQVTRSITLPETFVNEVDDSLFMNDSITNVPSSESPSLMENEIYGPLDDLLDDEVKAPHMFSDDTSCTICSGIFRDPRILGCGHTFCLMCLVRMHKHTRQAFLICPICREKTIVYSSDLKYLTKNFVVKNLVETIKLSSKNEKQLKSQLKISIENQTQLFDVKMSIAKEPRETKCFPLKEGRVMGVALMKQKIYLIFERSNQLLVIPTKTFLMGTPRREEIILIEEISNPLSMTSRADKSVLFILESSTRSSSEIFKSSVWKIVLPDGKISQAMKKRKWLDGIQTRESIICVSDSPMVMLLVFDEGQFSINFYLTEKEFGEMAKKIQLDEILRPVQFSRILGGSEIAISDFDGLSKTWTLSIINLDGKVVRKVNFNNEIQLSSLTSDHLKSLYFLEINKNQIFKMDWNLEESAILKIKNLSSKTLKFMDVVDEKRFVVCFEQQLCLYEL